MPAMSKRDKVLFAIIGASIVLFTVMDPYYFIWRSPPVAGGGGGDGGGKIETKVSSAVSAVKQSLGIERPSGPVRRLRDLKRMEFEGWGRDPFVQMQRGETYYKALDKMKLSGISVRGKNRFALINSEIVKPGDIIGGMKVVTIERDKVILSMDGNNYTLTWSNG